MALEATPVRAVEMDSRTIIEVEGQKAGYAKIPRQESPRLDHPKIRFLRHFRSVHYVKIPTAKAGP
jgi:hypothetical protein